MRLFQINEQLEALLNASVDPETGEVSEDAIKEIESLEMARDERLLAIAAYSIGQDAEGAAVKAQADRLYRRASIHANHAARLRKLIEDTLPVGSKLSNDHVALGWRTSRAVQVTDAEQIPDAFMRVKREPAKAEIGDALKAGETVPGCELVTRNNLVIR